MEQAWETKRGGMDPLLRPNGVGIVEYPVVEVQGLSAVTGEKAPFLSTAKLDTDTEFTRAPPQLNLAFSEDLTIQDAQARLPAILAVLVYIAPEAVSEQGLQNTRAGLEERRTTNKEATLGAGRETVNTPERMPDWLRAVLGADWMEVVVGVYEMAHVTDKIAVLLQPELLGVVGDDGDTEVALMVLEGNLHGAFGWSEQTTLRLGLLTPQSVEAYEGEGYRVIRVSRHPESEETPLPWEAVPVIVAEALAGGRPTFWVDVTPYLNLKGITLPEILSTLTDLFA